MSKIPPPPARRPDQRVVSPTKIVVALGVAKTRQRIAQLDGAELPSRSTPRWLTWIEPSVTKQQSRTVRVTTTAETMTVEGHCASLPAIGPGLRVRPRDGAVELRFSPKGTDETIVAAELHRGPIPTAQRVKLVAAGLLALLATCQLIFGEAGTVLTAALIAQLVVAIGFAVSTLPYLYVSRRLALDVASAVIRELGPVAAQTGEASPYRLGPAAPDHTAEEPRTEPVRPSR
ncbi:MAG: hypothetical protein B7733_00265 [Myxococcales bacterium FL481]|nr:MAG: hypothetical protein B7733_00265 [Myxococcales bacterium FL481]